MDFEGPNTTFDAHLRMVTALVSHFSHKNRVYRIQWVSCDFARGLVT